MVSQVEVALDTINIYLISDIIDLIVMLPFISH